MERDIEVSGESLSSKGDFIAYSATFEGAAFQCVIARSALHRLAGRNLRPFLKVFDANRQRIAEVTKQHLLDDPDHSPVVTATDF